MRIGRGGSDRRNRVTRGWNNGKERQKRDGTRERDSNGSNGMGRRNEGERPRRPGGRRFFMRPEAQKRTFRRTVNARNLEARER